MHSEYHRSFMRATGVLLGTVRRQVRQILSRSISRVRAVSGFSSGTPLLVGAIVALTLPCLQAQSPIFNYAEALQKSLYFFDANKSGPGITGGRVQWRGDSELFDTRVPLVPFVPINHRAPGVRLSQQFIDAHRAALDPDGDGFINVSGGFHDSGDHMRFGLPQAYSASTLAWSLFEFRDALVRSGQHDHLVEELRWFADCFLRCTFRDSTGNVIAFCYEVGDGGADHSYWGPPEAQSSTQDARPARFASAETPASDIVAAHAAALASIGLVLRSIDAPYSARCIETAQALYRFALAHRGLPLPDGFYNSYSDEDDLAWAAVWLFHATGNSQYLDDIERRDTAGNYTGFLSKILARPADDWANIWVHSWENVWGGVFLRLAALTGNSRYVAHAQWNVDYWMGKNLDPLGYNPLKSTPAGFRHLSNWGPTRYNCAAQLSALVLRKYTGQTALAEWARGQMNYIMGSNPMGVSYIVGFPTLAGSVKNPHHRAAHGSTTNNILEPLKSRHVLWGALVGGPNVEDHSHDAVTNFLSNEAALDFNASLVGALAGLSTYYGAGQKPLADFPPAELFFRGYFVEAQIGTGATRPIKIRVHAEPIHPPRVERALTARYFFDISELIAAGQSIADVSVGSFFQPGGPTPIGSPVLRSPKSWDGGSVYYIEVDWTGQEVYGVRDFQFILRARADGDGDVNWNPINDWSYQGLTNAYTIRPSIALYLNGVLTFGQEPPSTLAPSFSVLTTRATQTVVRGAGAPDLISILRTGGFTDSVTLSVSGLPTGVSASFLPAAVTLDRSVSVALRATRTATPGVYPLTFAGRGTPGTRTTTLDLTVSEELFPDFSLSATPSALTARTGVNGSSVITISRALGFTGPVNLEAIGLPPGVSAVFAPAQVNGTTSGLTLVATAAARVGTSRITIRGRSTTGLVHNTELELEVVDRITFACATPPAPITFPFVRDGAGEFCLVTSGTITLINSRVMRLVEVNGVDITNRSVTALPPRINGNYYIHGIGNVALSHLDVFGTP